MYKVWYHIELHWLSISIIFGFMLNGFHKELQRDGYSTYECTNQILSRYIFFHSTSTFVCYRRKISTEPKQSQNFFHLQGKAVWDTLRRGCRLALGVHDNKYKKTNPWIWFYLLTVIHQETLHMNQHQFNLSTLNALKSENLTINNGPYSLCFDRGVSSMLGDWACISCAHIWSLHWTLQANLYLHITFHEQLSVGLGLPLWWVNPGVSVMWNSSGW